MTGGPTRYVKAPAGLFGPLSEPCQEVRAPMEFQPDESEQGFEVPYFEEAKSEDGIKGHRTGKDIQTLKAEIRDAIARLGGGVIGIQRGTFATDPPRTGYVVAFLMGDHEGRLPVASLPIENKTDRRESQALKQALFTVRDILEAQYNLKLLSPGSNPLLPYLLGDGDRTVSEIYEEEYRIPAMSKREALQQTTTEGGPQTNDR